MTKVIFSEDCGNSPKNLLLRDFNIAVAKGDLEFIRKNIAEDIDWHLLEPAGHKWIHGRDNVLEEYTHNLIIVPVEFTIDNVISHGNTGAANGRIKAKGGKTYAFCDIYKFDGYTKSAKIKEMTSYTIETKE
jgi:hypothetical protein